MYVCCNCKKEVEHNDLRWIKGDEGENLSFCPYCNCEDLEEASYCCVCEKAFCEDDLIEGYCESCLTDKITFKSFRDFGLDGFKEDECSILEEFMFMRIYEFPPYEVPSISSYQMKLDFEAAYWKFAESHEKLIFDVVNFVMEYYAKEFAEYIKDADLRRKSGEKD